MTKEAPPSPRHRGQVRGQQMQAHFGFARLAPSRGDGSVPLGELFMEPGFDTQPAHDVKAAHCELHARAIRLFSCGTLAGKGP